MIATSDTQKGTQVRVNPQVISIHSEIFLLKFQLNHNFTQPHLGCVLYEHICPYIPTVTVSILAITVTETFLTGILVLVKYHNVRPGKSCKSSSSGRTRAMQCPQKYMC